MTQTTKTKIIAKAEALIREQGFEATSLNDVVEKAGVSKGAFFHYFPNKQAISREILDKYANEQIFLPLEKHLGSNAGSVKNGLFKFLEEMFGAYAQKKFKGGCLLGNFALELADRDEKAREHMKHIFLQWENQLVTHLKPAAEQGKLLMEPRQFARLLIATIEGITMMSRVHKDNIRASREFQALAELVERMMRD